MKRTISKLAIFISIGAPAVLTSGLAIAGGDVYKPTIWSGFYAGAHIGYTSLDAKIDDPGLVDQAGTCENMDSDTTGPTDNESAFNEMRKIIGTEVDGTGYRNGLNTLLRPGSTFNTNHGDHDCVGVGSFASSVEGGAIGGVHAGYNLQRGNFVFGVEGDYTKTKAEANTRASYSIIDTFDNHNNPIADNRTVAEATATTNIDLDAIASLRGRLGWAQDKNMFYITAGVAWAELDINRTETFTRLSNSSNFPLVENTSNSETVTGYVVGAGAERALAEGFTIRGEVLHYEFDDKGFEFNSTSGRVGFSIRLN